MKFQSVLRLALLPSLTFACYGANLAFPVIGITNGTQLDGTWSQTDGAIASDKLAFYSTIGSGYEGVSVGAYFDDYVGITDGGFTVGHATDSVAVGGATIDWHFVITPPTGDFSTTLNDYSISLFDSTATNVLTILLTNLDPTHWSAYSNGNYMGVIESNGFYELHAQFGATTGYFSSITGIGTISYTDSVSSNTGRTFDTVKIGTDEGAGNSDFGDGFITVVPEPSTALLGAIGLLGLLRRRR